MSDMEEYEQAAETVTRIEWGVRLPDGRVYECSELLSRQEVDTFPELTLVSRTVIETPWREVPND